MIEILFKRSSIIEKNKLIPWAKMKILGLNNHLVLVFPRLLRRNVKLNAKHELQALMMTEVNVS